MEETFNYYQRFSSAMVRGSLKEKYQSHELFSKILEDLTEEEHLQLFQIGEQNNLKLNFFQRIEALPETTKILDVLRGIAPDNLLDVGCGRGTLVWRLLDEYRSLPITAIDKSEMRINSIKSVIHGGVNSLKVKTMDVTDLSEFPTAAFDVTTALKVLELVEDVEKAVSEICRVTKRFAIVQFPVHQDNNPEKKHFFAPEQMKEMFDKHNVMQTKVEKISNYHVLVARK
jgi:ubiquinone/menaquinone biosynthesis C-methylase UbiE